jgi:nucleoside-diphosphate-sugar epimerase
MEILVTGANGFIGSNLVKYLIPSNLTVISRSNNNFDKGVKVIMLDLNELLSGSKIQGKYDVVVHLAGLAHRTTDFHLNPLNEFRKINKDVTIELARQLAVIGMKRFIFISSIAVNGASTHNRSPFTEKSQESPHSDSAISKFEAELELKKLAKLMNFELVIIRPPLVYGDNAPGNLGKLVNLVNKQLPLPFGWINNKRSYISVGNLTSFIITCLNHPKASNETFLISDGMVISTTGLIQKIKKSISSSSILLPIPKVFLHLLFTLLGKNNMAVQLLDDLEVDCSKAQNLLNWSPIETIDDSFSKLRQK